MSTSTTATAADRLENVLPPPPPAPELADQIDEALVGLPAPPRARTRILGGLLAAISVVSVLLAVQLRDDVGYFFASTTPTELGDGSATTVGHLGANRFVHLTASPQIAGAVLYSRLLVPGDHMVFPVAGRSGEPLYVQVDGTQAAPGEFSGRLIPFAGAGGRYGAVGRFLSHAMGAPVDGHTWLIVAGVAPRSLWWAPLLCSLLLALALTDLWFLGRLFRRSEP